VVSFFYFWHGGVTSRRQGGGWNLNWMEKKCRAWPGCVTDNWKEGLGFSAVVWGTNRQDRPSLSPIQLPCPGSLMLRAHETTRATASDDTTMF
jgi:hypothetical protein